MEVYSARRRFKGFQSKTGTSHLNPYEQLELVYFNDGNNRTLIEGLRVGAHWDMTSAIYLNPLVPFHF